LETTSLHGEGDLRRLFEQPTEVGFAKEWGDLQLPA